jgi:hypothetical protein
MDASHARLPFFFKRSFPIMLPICITPLVLPMPCYLCMPILLHSRLLTRMPKLHGKTLLTPNLSKKFFHSTCPAVFLPGSRTKELMTHPRIGAINCPFYSCAPDKLRNSFACSKLSLKHWDMKDYVRLSPPSDSTRTSIFFITCYWKVTKYSTSRPSTISAYRSMLSSSLILSLNSSTYPFRTLTNWGFAVILFSMLLIRQAMPTLSMTSTRCTEDPVLQIGKNKLSMCRTCLFPLYHSNNNSYSLGISQHSNHTWNTGQDY